MNIQLTNYGIAQLQAGVIPLVISKYELGTSYGYSPLMDATGLQGELLYSGIPTEPIIIDANTIKYVIGLGYSLGDFAFGEIALYDETDQCVATAVSDVPIAKQKYSSRKYGNSLVLDIYISITGTNYYAWVDELTSSNEFGIPVLQSIDALPPPSESSPNFYIISSPSSNASSSLAYCTNKGLWNFDTYQYDSTKQFTITGGSYNSITFDTNSLSSEDLEKLTSSYYGECLIQFGASNLAGTCRVIQRTITSKNTTTVIFKTPVAVIPNEGDKVMVFTRNTKSVSDSILPIATRDSLGTIKVGAGLDITPEGVLSAKEVSCAVTSVNGKVGEVVLKITDIPDSSKVAQTGKYSDLLEVPPGLSNPSDLTEDIDVNTVIESGVYTGTKATLSSNYPVNSDNPFSLEVIAQDNGVLQRYNDGKILAYRAYDGENWSAWVQVSTTASLPIASSTVLGAIKLGAGLGITEDGTVSTSVTSVFGRTGDVVITDNDIFPLLQPLYNVAGGIATLSQVEGETQQDILESARLSERNLTFGALYMPKGTWDASINSFNGDASYKLLSGGKILYKEDVGKYVEYSCKGWVLEVGVEGTTEIDNIASWDVGDLLFSTGSSWKKIYSKQTSSGSLEFPKESGILLWDASLQCLKATSLKSNSLSITYDDNINVELPAQEQIEPGAYSTVTINKNGIVVTAQKGIFGGNF